MSKKNFITVAAGEQLTAAAIQASGCSIIVVVPPANGPAVEIARICLPPAAEATGEISIVRQHDAFAYIAEAAPGEHVNGRPEYVKPGGHGTRLVPLVSGDGKSDGWGTT